MNESEPENENRFQPPTEAADDDAESEPVFSESTYSEASSWSRSQKYALAAIGMICIDFLVRLGDGRIYDLTWRVKAIPILVIIGVLIAWIFHNWFLSQARTLSHEELQSKRVYLIGHA